jgi:hypothetical protein
MAGTKKAIWAWETPGPFLGGAVLCPADKESSSCSSCCCSMFVCGAVVSPACIQLAPNTNMELGSHQKRANVTTSRLWLSVDHTSPRMVRPVVCVVAGTRLSQLGSFVVPMRANSPKNFHDTISVLRWWWIPTPVDEISGIPMNTSSTTRHLSSRVTTPDIQYSKVRRAKRRVSVAPPCFIWSQCNFWNPLREVVLRSRGRFPKSIKFAAGPPAATSAWTAGKTTLSPQLSVTSGSGSGTITVSVKGRKEGLSRRA